MLGGPDVHLGGAAGVFELDIYCIDSEIEGGVRTLLAGSEGSQGCKG